MNTKKARAMIAIGADSRAMDKELAAARKKLRGLAMAAGKEAKGALGKLGEVGKGIGGGVLTGLGMQGASGITDAIGDVFTFEKNLTRFQIVAGKTPDEMAKIRQSILDVSRATGVASADILAGAQTYVDLTGDVGGATSAMGSFARIAQASGSQVSDIATATAALQQSMKLDPTQIEAAFSGLIQQGKAGAVSLKDFAGQLSSIAPRFANFKGGTGVDAIREMGAAFQVARQGFGDAAETATGMESLMGSIVEHAKDFEKSGVKVFDKNPKTGAKTLKSFHEIMVAIGQSKLMKDPEALQKAFGRKEAMQTFMMLDRGLKTITDTGNAYDDMVNSGRDAGAVQRDLDTYMNSSAGKLEQTWASIKAAVAEAFTPDRIASFVNAMQQIGQFAEGIVKDMADMYGWIENIIGKSPEDQAKEIVDSQQGKTAPEKAVRAIIARSRVGDLESAGMGAGGPLSWAGEDAIKANKIAAFHLEEQSRGTDIGQGFKQNVPMPWARRAPAAPTPVVVKVGAEPIVRAAGNAMSARNSGGNGGH